MWDKEISVLIERHFNLPTSSTILGVDPTKEKLYYRPDI